MTQQILTLVKGKRTYILATLGVATVVAAFRGFITKDEAEMLLALFGFSGLAALRAGVDTAVDNALDKMFLTIEDDEATTPAE